MWESHTNRFQISFKGGIVCLSSIDATIANGTFLCCPCLIAYDGLTLAVGIFYVQGKQHFWSTAGARKLVITLNRNIIHSPAKHYPHFHLALAADDFCHVKGVV